MHPILSSRGRLALYLLAWSVLAVLLALLVMQPGRAGIRAEMYLGSSGMNAQMKYADRRNAAAAVIVGSNERAEGKVTIKDLAAGAEQAKAIKDNAEYKAAKVGQWVAARVDLVAELQKIPAVAKMVAEG